MKKHFPHILLAVYLLLFIVLAVNPYDRAVWWAENIPIILIVAAVILVQKKFEFSNLSYFMMFFLVVLHTIGGHFTFERVPFGYVNELFGFERNNYDRFAHFTVGFYAYPIAEYLFKRKLVSSKAVLLLFPIFTILSVAAVYEIIEWLYAISADESAGIAVLGSQGDIWDAQKDMLLDGLGSILAVILFTIVYSHDLFRSGKAK